MNTHRLKKAAKRLSENSTTLNVNAFIVSDDDMTELREAIAEPPPDRVDLDSAITMILSALRDAIPITEHADAAIISIVELIAAEVDYSEAHSLLKPMAVAVGDAWARNEHGVEPQLCDALNDLSRELRGL